MKLIAADGGDFWEARGGSFREEIGKIWTKCGIDSEYKPLRRVLMHRPGPEIENIPDAAPVLWKAILEPNRARDQHDNLAQTYRDMGVEVVYLQTEQTPRPNQYFMCDPFKMTPEGAIISRLASAARAGEERNVAYTLANLGVPIVMTTHGEGCLEGADIYFVEEDHAFISIGLRTNMAGASQAAYALEHMGVNTTIVQSTFGCGHIDGVLAFVDKRKAIVYPTRLDYSAYELLKDLGYQIILVPDFEEAENTMAINMVPVAPSVVVMPAGNVKMQRVLEENGVECHTVELDELMKGGGSVHCMSGILLRDMG